jgi:hypothetical protein
VALAVVFDAEDATLVGGDFSKDFFLALGEFGVVNEVGLVGGGYESVIRWSGVGLARGRLVDIGGQSLPALGKVSLP